MDVELWDTAGKYLARSILFTTTNNFLQKGQEMYDRLRILAYPDADAILIAYDIGDPQTLANVPEKVE